MNVNLETLQDDNGEEVADFLANVQSEGLEPEDTNTDEQETETPAGSLADNNQTEQSPSQEGEPSEEAQAEPDNTPDVNNDVPLNKNPRFQEVVQEKNSYKQQLDEVLARFSELSDKVERSQAEPPQAKAAVSIPKFFTDIYGEDPEAYAEFLNTNRQEAIRVIEEREQEAKARQEQTQKDQERDNQYLQDQFNKIEEVHGARLEKGTSERNDFVAFVAKYKPTTQDGTGLDLLAGYELYSQLKGLDAVKQKATTSEKKNVASATMDKGSSAQDTTQLTHEQMSKMSMQDIARLALKENGLL